MAFSTFPNNPFPPSTAQFNEGKNDAIQAEIDAIKDGSTIDSFGGVETALATKTNLSNIAPAFDATSGVYAIGDKVIYDGVLYEFTSAHATAGEWDENEAQPVKVSELIDTLKSGLTNVETVLTSMDRVIPFPFTMPNDSSSRAVDETIEINLSATVPETAYMIGVSVHVFAQKRTIVGAYFRQASFDANHLYLIDVLKAIPSYYDGISGYLIVGIPHT